MEEDVRNEDAPDEVTAGALDMKNGAHKRTIANNVVGHKFYTVGRARYQPFVPPVPNEPQFRDFKLGLPMAYNLAMDVFADAFTRVTGENNEETLDQIREVTKITWPQQVLANLNAHSGLVGEKFSKAAAKGTFCFDVKLMLQEPVRQSTDLDINKDQGRADALNKLRILRMRLTRSLPLNVLQKLFRGWKDLYSNDAAENNPYYDPFNDMTEEDFSPVPGVTLKAAEFDQGTQFFVFNENFDQSDFELQGPVAAVPDLAGGEAPLFRDVQKTYSKDTNAFVRLSAFGHAHSKFFDAMNAELLAERSQVFEHDNAFVFVQKSSTTAWAHPDMPMYIFVAYGFDSSNAGYQIVQKAMYELGANEAAVVVPSAMPAFEDGQQECPERPGWIDLDIAKFWVKHFHGKALTKLPRMSLDLLRTSKHQKYSKYDAYYEALRCNDAVGPIVVPHIECADTGVPHEFLVHIRM